MLVEKKTWKNLIKPVLMYLGFCFLIFFLYSALSNLEKDFHQIDKVDDLSTLNNDELLNYEIEL